MARFPKPPEGSWTEHYPELGTAPVSYEDSISPEFYERRSAKPSSSARGSTSGASSSCPADGSLLHEGARGRRHVDRGRA